MPATPPPPPPAGPAPRLDVLIVEDDRGLREVLEYHLRAEGWSVRGAGDGDAALRACAEKRPDIVVLDVMLPARSGLEVCAALRAEYHPSPGVLMLTARDAEVDVILGLEVGADDYVVKPCRPRELVARLRALSRRVLPRAGGGAREPDASPGSPASSPPQPGPLTPSRGVEREDVPLERGPLRVEPAARRVTVDGAAVRLTPTEFALLALLAREPERVYSRMELLERVFDSTHEGYARNVDCHVTRVRRKLEAAGLRPSPLRTAHGAGYYFVTPDAPAPR